MLYACWRVYSGSVAQTRTHLDVEAPVSGWSMAWLTGVGVVFAVSAAIRHAFMLGKLLTGRLPESELVTLEECEDLAPLNADAADKP